MIMIGIYSRTVRIFPPKNKFSWVFLLLLPQKSVRRCCFSGEGAKDYGCIVWGALSGFRINCLDFEYLLPFQ
jgi:hypothetical protein